MSESKVPQIDRLPDGLAGWVCRYQVLTPHGWIGAWDKEAIEWYGDARAAEARRLALLEAASLCRAMMPVEGVIRRTLMDLERAILEA